MGGRRGNHNGRWKMPDYRSDITSSATISGLKTYFVLIWSHLFLFPTSSRNITAKLNLRAAVDPSVNMHVRLYPASFKKLFRLDIRIFIFLFDLFALPMPAPSKRKSSVCHCLWVGLALASTWYYNPLIETF